MSILKIFRKVSQALYPKRFEKKIFLSSAAGYPIILLKMTPSQELLFELIELSISRSPLNIALLYANLSC